MRYWIWIILVHPLFVNPSIWVTVLFILISVTGTTDSEQPDASIYMVELVFAF